MNVYLHKCRVTYNAWRDWHAKFSDRVHELPREAGNAALGSWERTHRLRQMRFQTVLATDVMLWNKWDSLLFAGGWLRTNVNMRGMKSCLHSYGRLLFVRFLWRFVVFFLCDFKSPKFAAAKSRLFDPCSNLDATSSKKLPLSGESNFIKFLPNYIAHRKESFRQILLVKCMTDYRKPIMPPYSFSWIKSKWKEFRSSSLAELTVHVFQKMSPYSFPE